MQSVKFGIIGCGRNASFHLSANRNNPKVEFVAAYDPDEETLNRFSKRNKMTPFDDLDDFLQSDFDAVFITTPHYLHKPLTIAGAKAGKHVLCEKPMANTIEECDEMIAATRSAGVKFMIAENHRFLPAHQFIKDTVSRGLIGDVFLVRTYEGAYVDQNRIIDPNFWMFTYAQGGGGALHDQGAHKFALLNWLLGEVDSALCWCGKAINSPPPIGEDTSMTLLRYKNGAMAEVTLSSATIHIPTNRLELHGTKGTIVEDHDWEQPVKIYSVHEDAEKKGEYYCPDIEHGPFPQYYTISFRHEDTHFAECILNDIEPEFTPEEAREAIAVIYLSYLAAKKGAVATMDEFKAIVKESGTKAIYDGLEEVPLKNYEKLRW